MSVIILSASLATLGILHPQPASTSQDSSFSGASDNSSALAPIVEEHNDSAATSGVNATKAENVAAEAARDYDPALQSRFLFGVGPEEWNSLDGFNEKYGMNMNLATSWINGRLDLYGWWNASFFPEVLWDKGNVPHIITWGYFYHSWNVDYSAENLSNCKQQWFDDLTFMAGRLKGPDDGRHLVLISLETEFNCYDNINCSYWNQLMIESKNVLKSVAPNVRVSYSFGGWAWRGGDISVNNTLSQSMREMDFLSFQCMWGAYNNSQIKWVSGIDLRGDYQGVNWTQLYGTKPKIWNYMVDDIISNLKALSKYNKNILLAHFCIDHHLWGTEAQIEVLRDMSNNLSYMRQMGLFGFSWMEYCDSRWDNQDIWPGDIGGQTGGFQFPDGSPKPCLSEWAKLVNSLF